MALGFGSKITVGYLRKKKVKKKTNTTRKLLLFNTLETLEVDGLDSQALSINAVAASEGKFGPIQLV